MSDDKAKEEEREFLKCYGIHCHDCKTANPNSCTIASDARSYEKFGKNWYRYYADYRCE